LPAEFARRPRRWFLSFSTVIVLPVGRTVSALDVAASFAVHLDDAHRCGGLSTRLPA